MCLVCFILYQHLILEEYAVGSHYQRDPGSCLSNVKSPKLPPKLRIWGGCPWLLFFLGAAFQLFHVPSGRKNKLVQTGAHSSCLPSKRSIRNPLVPHGSALPDRKMKISSPICFMTFISKLNNLTHCQSPLLLQKINLIMGSWTDG